MVLIVMNFLLLVVFVDIHSCNVMVIENESKNVKMKILVLSVTMTETRVTLSRERKLDWLSQPRPMALLHKESFE